MGSLIPDLDIVLAWIAYLYMGETPIWGTLHAIIPAAVTALLVGLLGYIILEKERSPLRLKWTLISVLSGTFLTEIMLDILSKPGYPFLAPFSYQPNPFVVLSHHEANLLAASMALVMFLYLHYLYARGVPILTIEDKAFLLSLERTLKPTFVTQHMLTLESRFLMLSLFIFFTGLASMALPGFEDFLFVICVGSVAYLLSMAYQFRV
jgi:hypothetical protein